MTKNIEDKNFKITLDFFQGNEFAASTFLQKYALRDKEGNILEYDPKKTIDRVMTVLANNMPTEYPTEDWISKYNKGTRETWKTLFINACGNFTGLIPQGSVLSAAGDTNRLQSISNCFVVPSPHDSIAGIMQANERMSQVYKRRGGCGIDLSSLRPEGSPVKNAALASTGAWGWANHFSNTCRDVAMLGRRGAQMITLDIKHPDSTKFATMKNDPTYCTGANISLWITDEFMKLVEENKPFKRQFPIDSNSPIVVDEINACNLWDTICKSAWTRAEPGLLFRNTIENNLPAHCYSKYRICSTNPCSEIALSAFDACRLSTICLTKYVDNPFQSNSSFNFLKFEQDIRIGMRLMDSIVTTEIAHIDAILDKMLKEQGSSTDPNLYNIEIDLWTRIRAACVGGRRCGLGTHGLGDCLAQLCIKYDSEEALTFLHKLYGCFRDSAYDESVEMAKEYGAFPDFNWEVEKDCEFIKRLPTVLQEKIQQYGRRNISLLTCAPTGTISILSQCSSGIEPTFKHLYIRRRKINHNDSNPRIDFIDQVGDKWQNFPQFEKNIQKYLKLMNVVIPDSIYKDEELQKYLPNYFITADKIDWKNRIRLQGTIQIYLDHSISSTVNLPSDTKVETIKDIYMEAWKQGLKGITVYRDGCRSGVLITDQDNKQAEKSRDTIMRSEAPKRPTKLPCEVHVTKVKGIDYVVIVGLYKGTVYEVFCGEYNNQIPKKQFSGFVERKNKGKYVLNYIDYTEYMQLDINEYFNNERHETATRLLSMSLRHGTPLEYIIDQLQKSGSNMFEFGPALSRILKKYVKLEDLKRLYSNCNHCDSTNVELVFENGCFTIRCNSCNTVDSKCN